MSRFGKIELSDPQFEPRHLRFLTFNSPALGGRGDVALFIPPNSAEMSDLPLVVVLHGVYCSHWAWAMKGGIHLTAAAMMASAEIPPMAIAMPSDGLWGEGSGYLPHETANYEAWIVEDVVDCVTEVVAQVGENSAVFLSGQSMGGFGALRLGAKYPQRFQALSGHSSVTRASDLKRYLGQRPFPILVDDPAETTVAFWMEKHRSALPPIRFDCGLDDRLLAANRELHQQLSDLGIDHQYDEFPGGHTWPYWAEHFKDTLRFFGDKVRS